MAVVYSPVQWSSIRHFSPADFKLPSRLDDSVVRSLDKFVDLNPDLPRPIVLDDVTPREENPSSQHPAGRALDLTFPGADSVLVLDRIRAARLFSGIGIYTNELGAESFHVDTRTNRTPEDPAKWGAWKDRTAGVYDWQYTSLEAVLDIVKKKSAMILPVLLIFAGIYLLLRN